MCDRAFLANLAANSRSFNLITASLIAFADPGLTNNNCSPSPPNSVTSSQH